MGTPGPPSFSTFLLRRELKEQLGMSLEEFRALPWPEAEDYLLYMQMIRREEAHQRSRSNAR
jgi:hypothetical protein